MRCGIKMAEGHFEIPCVVILDGERRGEAMEEGAIRDAVLDVSDFIENSGR
jgi:hypothetical protein